MLTRRITLSFALEAIVCVASVILLCITVLSPTWIETVFGVDPDHGSGTFEGALVLATGLAALTSAVLARREWRQLATANVD